MQNCKLSPGFLINKIDKAAAELLGQIKFLPKRSSMYFSIAAVF